MNNLKHFNPMKLREKYSIKKSTGNNYSSFWLDNDWDTTSVWDDEDLSLIHISEPTRPY